MPGAVTFRSRCPSESCPHCQRLADVAERRRLPIPIQIQHRTEAEVERAAEVVRHLRGLTLYEQARWCEQVLATHLPGIEVRPERRRQRRAA